MIAQNDIPVSDDHLALIYIIAALIMVVVAIVVIAWLASVVARLLEWRRGHRARRAMRGPGSHPG